MVLGCPDYQDASIALVAVGSGYSPRTSDLGSIAIARPVAASALLNRVSTGDRSIPAIAVGVVGGEGVSDGLPCHARGRVRGKQNVVK